MSAFSILIVDDVKENIYSLKLMIEDSFDINIYSAISAKDGIEILAKENIDLILSDVQMPDIDGFEFAEYLKSIERTKNVPIIFITGIYDKDEYITKGYKLGAVDYITKPINDDLLNSKLKVYIDIFEKNKKNENLIEEKNKLLIQQSKMATVGEMMAIITHQLKQPLNALSLYCDDVQNTYLKEEIDEGFISKFSSNTKEQISFLSNTIDVFRDFFNPSKLKKQFELKLCMEKAILLLNNKLNSSSIILDINISDEKVFGVQSELEQVFLNIIMNSIDAFKELEIEKKTIIISVLRKEGYTILILEDNAGGVKEEYLGKICDAYFTTKDKGLGIGLYMVKLVVKNTFNGDLRITNTNSGLRYMIALPQS